MKPRSIRRSEQVYDVPGHAYDRALYKAKGFETLVTINPHLAPDPLPPPRVVHIMDRVF